MKKAVVLLSGGLDSTTCAAMLVKQLGSANVIALSLGYGQKHLVELEQAKLIAKNLNIVHIIKELPPVFSGAGSTLIDADCPNPETTYEELAKSTGVSPTYVPFRNGNLLSAAAALALTIGADTICYGAHSEDAREWAYPDCSAEFIGAMACAIYIGTYHKVRLYTPLVNDTKFDVVVRGFDAGAPFELTHSCYNGARPACGVCPTCIGRIAAFKQAGVKDPIAYAINIDWE
jgi:7-cyano-7-deazaguanine synthase